FGRRPRSERHRPDPADTGAVRAAVSGKCRTAEAAESFPLGKDPRARRIRGPRREEAMRRVHLLTCGLVVLVTAACGQQSSQQPKPVADSASGAAGAPQPVSAADRNAILKK